MGQASMEVQEFNSVDCQKLSVESRIGLLTSLNGKGFWSNMRAPSTFDQMVIGFL